MYMREEAEDGGRKGRMKNKNTGMLAGEREEGDEKNIGEEKDVKPVHCGNIAHVSPVLGTLAGDPRCI